MSPTVPKTSFSKNNVFMFSFLYDIFNYFKFKEASTFLGSTGFTFESICLMIYTIIWRRITLKLLLPSFTTYSVCEIYVFIRYTCPTTSEIKDRGTYLNRMWFRRKAILAKTASKFPNFCLILSEPSANWQYFRHIFTNDQYSWLNEVTRPCTMKGEETVNGRVCYEPLEWYALSRSRPVCF